MGSLCRSRCKTSLPKRNNRNIMISSDLDGRAMLGSMVDRIRLLNILAMQFRSMKIFRSSMMAIRNAESQQLSGGFGRAVIRDSRSMTWRIVSVCEAGRFRPIRLPARFQKPVFSASWSSETLPAKWPTCCLTI